MIKKLIKPVQDLLLKKHYCVGCVNNLDLIIKRTKLQQNKEILQCKCSRRYIWDTLNNIYKRATFEEESKYLDLLKNNKKIKK